MTADARPLRALAHGAVLSPFTRTARLLDGIAPGHKKPIEMTVGDPREAMPAFVTDKLEEAKALLGTYPEIRGSDELRKAIAAWIGRRYGLARCVDFDARDTARQRLARRPVLRGVAGRRPQELRRPADHAGDQSRSIRPTSAAPTAPAASLYLNATAETGHLPDLDALESEPDILRRTAGFFLCSPSNPQGAVASARLHPQRAGAGAPATTSSCSSTSATRRSTRGAAADRRPRDRRRHAGALQEPGRLQLAVQALEPAGHALGLRRRRRRLPGDAGRDPQPAGAADAGPRAARLGGGVVGGAACRRHPPRPIAPSSMSATSC